MGNASKNAVVWDRFEYADRGEVAGGAGATPVVTSKRLTDGSGSQTK